MKLYLFIALITITTCLKTINMNDLQLTKINKPLDLDQENLKFTVCLEFIKSDEYKNQLKEYLSELPDDLNELEVGFEICNKLYEMEEFQQALDYILKNTGKPRFLYQKATIKQILPKNTNPIKDIGTIVERPIEPLPSLDNIKLQKIRWHFKDFLKGLVRVAVGIFTLNGDRIVEGADMVIDSFEEIKEEEPIYYYA